jgi:hypothetical protein
MVHFRYAPQGVASTGRSSSRAPSPVLTDCLQTLH